MMEDILNMVSQLHFISTKDQDVFKEVKEIITQATQMVGGYENSNRVVYKLTYNPKKQEYLIKHMSSKIVDYSKVTHEVAQFSKYVWVCKDKTKLEAYIEILKEERRLKYENY